MSCRIKGWTVKGKGKKHCELWNSLMVRNLGKTRGTRGWFYDRQLSFSMKRLLKRSSSWCYPLVVNVPQIPRWFPPNISKSRYTRRIVLKVHYYIRPHLTSIGLDRHSCLWVRRRLATNCRFLTIDTRPSMTSLLNFYRVLQNVYSFLFFFNFFTFKIFHIFFSYVNITELARPVKQVETFDIPNLPINFDVKQESVLRITVVFDRPIMLIL